MKATHKTVAAIVGAVLLAALVVVTSFWAFRQIESAAAERKYSGDSLNLADDWLTAMLDAETGARGFALTGDAAFLAPYLAVKDSVVGKLIDLRARTTIASAQQRLDAITPLMTARMAELSKVVELRRRQDMPAALAVVSGGVGRRLMDSIRAEMKAFVQIEESARTQHNADFQSNMRTLFVTITVACLLTLLSAIAFVILIFRDSRHRIKDQVLAETQNLYDVQTLTNKQLQVANGALQENQEKLAVTLNSIGDAVIATDANGHVTLLNPLAERLTGWTLAEASGQSVNDIFRIINQETREPCKVPVAQTLAEGTVQGLANHTILIARNGSECAIADSCAPIRNREGQVVGAVLVFRDVTDEYAAQKALRESNALIQTILNTAVDGIATIHADTGQIEIVNPATARMFGYAAAELVGRDFSVLIPALTSGKSGDTLEVYCANNDARAKDLGREVFGRHNDGSTFPIEMSVSEMHLDGQRHFTCILRDISARKQAEGTLLEAGALQNAIFNSANFSSIATDAKGVIQIFNVGAEHMLGYSAAEVMNKITPADISDPQEVIARAEALSLELATRIQPGFEALAYKASRGIEDIYELTYIRKDGSRFPAVVSVTALRDVRDGVIGYLLIGTDNSARKQASQYARSLIEASLDPLVTISAEGKITDVNEGSIKVTGVPRQKLVGTDFSDYFTEPERAREGYREAFSKGAVTDYPLTIRHADGRLTDVLYNASVYKDVQGNVLGVFAAARDVTARKQAEAALLKAGALQSAIFNSANFSSIATDAKGVIQIFNVGAERMLGYTAADVMNKITPADISDPQEVIARADCGHSMSGGRRPGAIRATTRQSQKE